MRAAMHSCSIRQTCIKLITDSICHGLKWSQLVAFFAGPIIVPAHDCRRQSKGINISSCFTQNYAVFHRVFQAGESMENELSCHIRTSADNAGTFSQ